MLVQVKTTTLTPMSDHNLGTIGKYRKLKRIGTGATSEVYLARDDFLDRDIALKIFNREAMVAGSDVLSQTGFLVELALLNKLDHPHVVKVLDACAGPDDFFIVSEFVPGGTLADYCVMGRRMEFEAACDVVYKCAKALEYLHQQGITHRDIKPDNVFVGAGTDVKVGDFGAATVRGVPASMVSSVGSLRYMSPERHAGESASLASDVFSVGVMFYQLLTGRHPFDANSLAAMTYQMQNMAPPSPSIVNERLPSAVDPIVLKCLAPRADDRYRTWDDLAEALAAAMFRHDDGRLHRHMLVTAAARFEALRKAAFFERFEDAALWELVEHSDFRTTVEGDVLFREGEVAFEFLILIEGSVRVTKRGQVIDVVLPGATIGEVAYVLGQNTPRNASCVALDSGLALSVSFEAMTMLSVACRHRLESEFLKILAWRLVGANRRLTSE